MKVLVLGCGPSGLAAAHAATELGHDVMVASKKRKSQMFGAQYLHAPIPGVTPADEWREVTYDLRGTYEQYRRKVYGENARVTSVSPEEFGKPHRAWDIRSTYNELWLRYEDIVLNHQWDPVSSGQMLEEAQANNVMVVSSLPAELLCQKPLEHKFLYQKIWAAGDAPELDRWSPVRCAPDTIVCNGEASPHWYRVAQVFGLVTCEWPETPKPPFAVSEVRKPISTTCDCWPNVLRVGRYGQWKKGVLVHHAYAEVMEALVGPLQESLW